VNPATVPLILKAGTSAQTTQQALAHLSKLLPEGGGMGGVAQSDAFSPDAILDLLGSLKVRATFFVPFFLLLPCSLSFLLPPRLRVCWIPSLRTLLILIA